MIVLLRLSAALFGCIDALLGNVCTPQDIQRRLHRSATIRISTCWLPHYRAEQKKLDQIICDPFITVTATDGKAHYVTILGLCTTFRGSP